MAPRIRSSSDGSGDSLSPGDMPADSTSKTGGIAAGAPPLLTTTLQPAASKLFGSYFGTMTKKKVALMTFLALLAIALTAFVLLYTCHRGFRRTVHFWSRAIPWIVEFNIIKLHSHYIAHHSDVEWEQLRQDYHLAVAPKVVQMIQDMGGIYPKIGQALSTMGSGILPEEYVQAMRPLQDGIPPRDYATIARIIETSTGRKMEDIFVEFEPQPIGAATIGQAHRAILKGYDDNQRDQQQVVVVKVQYPEVAELFDADLRNLELLSWLLSPAGSRSQDLLKNVRERHEREMDFRLEADHLRECSTNMQKHGLEPALVRIPKVMNETGLCTKNVLVMEYLKGVGLRDVMEEEQDRIARALGKKNGEELRYVIAKRIKEHFDQGGGEGNNEGETQLNLIGGGRGGGKGNSAAAGLWNALGPFAIHGLRRYARIRDAVVQFASRMRNNNSKDQAESIKPSSTKSSRSSSSRHINLGKVLKTVIQVHAVQVMMDGIYNLDPHPGNIIVMDDGRVGLLDYGMVGHLNDEQRLRIAETVYHLAHNNPHKLAKLYLEDGYHINYDGNKVEDPNVLFRISNTHFNKLDLTPITLSDASTFKHDGTGKVGMIELFEKMDVIFIPDWIIQARRVGRLMMGVNAQAARPISLAKEWEPVAKRALREMKKQRQSSSKHQIKKFR